MLLCHILTNEYRVGKASNPTVERPPNYQCMAFCVHPLVEVREGGGAWRCEMYIYCPCGYSLLKAKVQIRPVQRWKSLRIKIHRLGYRFLNPSPKEWFSFWKSQTFGKSLFFRFSGIDFPMDFWWYWMCFIFVLFKAFLIVYFTKAVRSNIDHLQKHFLYYRMVSCAQDPQSTSLQLRIPAKTLAKPRS